MYFIENNNTVYATEESQARLEAHFYTSSSSAPSVQWYHQGTPLNDTRYTENSEGSSNMLVLTVEEVGPELLGLYTVEVTVGGVTKNANVTLQFSGEG